MIKTEITTQILCVVLEFDFQKKLNYHRDKCIIQASNSAQ